MKMLFTMCRGHKARKGRSTANPLNDLTLTQLYKVWSSSVAADKNHNAEHIEQRIRRYVQEEGLDINPPHLMRALIRFTMACNDYAYQCVERDPSPAKPEAGV